MKKIFLVAMTAISLYLGGCNSNTSSTVTTDAAGESETEKTPSESVNAALNSIDAFTKKLEELKKLKPLTEDEVKKMLPQELSGLKRGEITVNKIAGTMAFADYTKAGGGKFSAYVTDCSGELGAGKYMLGYANPAAAEDSKPAVKGAEALTTQKKVDFEGRKAITFHDPVNDVYSIVFIKKERLLVKIEGASKTSLAGVITFAEKFSAQL